MRGGLAIAAASLAGCFGIYGEISDLEDATVVHESTRPDTIASNDYGIEIVFGGSGGEGLEVTVLGSSPAGVVNLRYDRSGDLDSSGLELGAEVSDITAGVATAGVPPRFDDGDSVAVALPLAAGGARIVLFDADSSEIDGKQFNLDAVPAGLAIGVTNTTMDAGLEQPDLIAAGDAELVMFANYPAAAPEPEPTSVFRCALPEPALEVLAADLFARVSDGDEIAVAGGGAVRVIRGVTVETRSAAMGGCYDAAAPFELAAPMGEADFGASLAAADLDGSGLADLIVAAPSANRVYIFFDLDESQAPASTVIEGTGDFGSAIAAGDLDGDGVDELAVGAPAGAGRVHLYEVAGGAATEAITLTLADADDVSFGRALAVGRFGDADDLLVAAARDKIFVYFEHPLPGDRDPRER